MATGYIAIDRPEFWWTWQNARSVISRYKSNKYPSNTATWPNNRSDDQVLKLEADEYPTGVSLSGKITSLSYNTNVTLALCDSEGNNSHTLKTVWCEGPTTTDPDIGGSGYPENHPVQLSSFNVSSVAWTNLAGCVLALSRPSSETYNYYSKNTIIENTATINVSTAYIAKPITINTVGAGTATASANSCTRGQVITLTLTPAIGYKVGNVVATGGTLARTSSTTYTFTMPTPAQNITITVNFNPFTFFAAQGEIIYADWYNQE